VGGWHPRDVTHDSGAQNPAASGTALSATILGNDPRVYYLDGNSHINELAWHSTDSNWHWRDLTNDAGVLTSNRNAVLVNETGNTCNSLQNLTVRLEVTEDLITQGDTGFTLQLNTTPQPGANCQGQPLSWFQYVIYISNNQACYQIEYWSFNNHAWRKGYTPITNTTPKLPCFGNDLTPFGTLSSNQVPASSVMEIALTTDSNANVTGATFSITDPSGNVSKPPNPWSAPPGETFPISAFTVNLVGPGNASSCAFTSGKGLLTYSVSQTQGLAVQDGGSSVACGDPSVTAETSNAVYGAVTRPINTPLSFVTQTLTIWPLSPP